ncbi:MAG TPA: TlpA disulfide reductase family protein, partial [Steroidobacteraceae bacterium]|nr:TlpA disulfide reductase family protein [Steroidobacteraceae bacterium]
MRVTQRFRIAARPTVRHCTGGKWLAACAAALCAIAFAGSPAVADGDPRLAPDFALRSLDQGNQRLSEYRGDVVVLCFWASWCGDCRRRLPQLNELYDEHRAAGLAVLGINLDEDAGRAREFARVLGLEFPV